MEILKWDTLTYALKFPFTDRIPTSLNWFLEEIGQPIFSVQGNHTQKKLILDRSQPASPPTLSLLGTRLKGDIPRLSFLSPLPDFDWNLSPSFSVRDTHWHWQLHLQEVGSAILIRNQEAGTQILIRNQEAGTQKFIKIRKRGSKNLSKLKGSWPFLH